MKITKASLLFLMMLMMSVSFSYAQEDEEEESGDDTETTASKYGATPEDSVQCVNNYSLYIEYYKQKAYNDAIKGWRKVCVYCPQLSKSTFINGSKMYKDFIKKETDETKQAAYVDTLMMIYDDRIKYFGQEGYVLERKGGDLLKYKKEDPKSAYETLKRSYELQGKEMGGIAIYNYYKSIYLMAKKKEATKDDLINMFAELVAIVDENIATAKDEKAKSSYEKAKANMEKIFTGVAKCDDLVEFYTPKFEANPTDTVLLKNIVKFLGKQDCQEDQLYEDAASKLCGISPSYDCAMALGKLLSKKDDYNSALGHFKTAIENAKTDEEKIEANYMAALCSYNLKQLSNVRTYCRTILGVDPNNGDAYLLIGDVYAASAGQCGDNDCTKKAAYWAAVDKYAKAKAVDPNVADKASKKIAAATGQFPKKTDCFFHSINEGDSYTVGCWINETTKVRVNE